MTTRDEKQPTAAEAIGCKEPPYQGSNLMHTTISSNPHQDKPHAAAIILVLVIAGSVAAAAIGVAVSAAPMVTVTAACIQTLAIVLATAAAIGA